ncbi:unnamed protein product, partial [Vitis vinifera]
MTNQAFKTSFVYNEDEAYYLYELKDNLSITRLTLNELGSINRFVLSESSTEWAIMYTVQNDLCDNYGHCGANGFCRIGNTPICECLDGFVPKSQNEWEFLNWTSGCIRSTPLDCQKGEGFIEVKGVKLPDLLDFWVNKRTTLRECRAECLKNCSCTAYANSNISKGGSGCLMWFGNLIDVREFHAQESEQTVYVRMPASELESRRNSSQKRKHLVIVVLVSMASVVLILGLYAVDGQFSVKSDVFSLGVLLLEIVSGKKNRGFCHPDHYHNLLGHVWLLWNENRALELMEPCLVDSYVESQVLRCIQVGLLCIQKLPEDRPSMSSVVLMLVNEEITLPQP